mmetsp:Transcript_7503/g.23986  ORF Transcript_7503/g.23986 Transcript_7503/m.23986 type:complete len:263 (+) Transcript_7503:1012-1800(+)
MHSARVRLVWSAGGRRALECVFRVGQRPHDSLVHHAEDQGPSAQHRGNRQLRLRIFDQQLACRTRLVFPRVNRVARRRRFAGRVNQVPRAWRPHDPFVWYSLSVWHVHAHSPRAGRQRLVSRAPRSSSSRRAARHHLLRDRSVCRAVVQPLWRHARPSRPGSVPHRATATNYGHSRPAHGCAPGLARVALLLCVPAAHRRHLQHLQRARGSRRRPPLQQHSRQAPGLCDLWGRACGACHARGCVQPLQALGCRPRCALCHEH